MFVFVTQNPRRNQTTTSNENSNTKAQDRNGQKKQTVKTTVVARRFSKPFLFTFSSIKLFPFFYLIAIINGRTSRRKTPPGQAKALDIWRMETKVEVGAGRLADLNVLCFCFMFFAGFLWLFFVFWSCKSCVLHVLMCFFGWSLFCDVE